MPARIVPMHNANETMLAAVKRRQRMTFREFNTHLIAFSSLARGNCVEGEYRVESVRHKYFATELARVTYDKLHNWCHIPPRVQEMPISISDDDVHLPTQILVSLLNDSCLIVEPRIIASAFVND